MRFEIPFNERIVNLQCQMFFDFHYAKFLSQQKNFLLYGIVMTFFGSLIIYGNGNIGCIIVMFGALLLYLYIIRFRLYKKNKKIYFESNQIRIAEKLGLNNFRNVWEFKDDCLLFIDSDFELKINWKLFKSYKKLAKDVLLLEVNNTLLFNLILSEEEVGQENFDKIIHFLEGKIKNQ